MRRSRGKQLKVLLFIACFGVWFYTIVKPKQITQLEQQQQSQTGPTWKSKDTAPRRNVLIVAHARSGTTLTGDIFNHHPNVFYMFEPLQAVDRVHGEFNRKHDEQARQFLQNIFQCKFDGVDYVKDIESFYRQHAKLSYAIAQSPPLCPQNANDPKWNLEKCYFPLTQEILESACGQSYDVNVLKLLMRRIPRQNIESLLSVCNVPGADCKVIFLVRDPRGMVLSSKTRGIFIETDPEGRSRTSRYSYRHCKTTEENLKSLKNLPSWARGRVKILRYEDLALQPLQQLSDLYKFAGLSMLDSVVTWLNKTTHPSKKEAKKTRGRLISTVRDAHEAVHKWRWIEDPADTAVVERNCGNVMRLMGYTPTNGDYNLQRNLTIPLFTETYIAQKWSSPLLSWE